MLFFIISFLCCFPLYSSLSEGEKFYFSSGVDQYACDIFDDGEMGVFLLKGHLLSYQIIDTFGALSGSENTVKTTTGSAAWVEMKIMNDSFFLLCWGESQTSFYIFCRIYERNFTFIVEFNYTTTGLISRKAVIVPMRVSGIIIIFAQLSSTNGYFKLNRWHYTGQLIKINGPYGATKTELICQIRDGIEAVVFTVETGTLYAGNVNPANGAPANASNVNLGSTYLSQGLSKLFFSQNNDKYWVTYVNTVNPGVASFLITYNEDVVGTQFQIWKQPEVAFNNCLCLKPKALPNSDNVLFCKQNITQQVVMRLYNSGGSAKGSNVVIFNQDYSTSPDNIYLNTFNDSSSCFFGLADQGQIMVSCYNADLQPIYKKESCLPPKEISADKLSCSIPYCATMLNETVCGQCNSPYKLTLDQTACINPIINKCEEYISQVECAVCETGTVLTLNGYNCAPIIPNCVRYADNKTCSQCAAGFTLLQSLTICNQDIIDCLDYTIDGKCATCAPKKILSTDQESCFNEIPHCISYFQNHTCELCEDSYFVSLNREACELKIANYSNCSVSNESQCVNCSKNTVLANGGSICVVPVVDCVWYLQNLTGDYCDQCEGTKVVTIGGKTCADNIVNCSIYSDGKKCLNCTSPKILSPNRLHCTDAIIDCRSYRDDGGCLLCGNNKSLTFDSKACMTPIEDCRNMSSNGRCYMCSENTSLSPGNTSCVKRLSPTNLKAKSTSNSSFWDDNLWWIIFLIIAILSCLIISFLWSKYRKYRKEKNNKIHHFELGSPVDDQIGGFFRQEVTKEQTSSHSVGVLGDSPVHNGPVSFKKTENL